MPISVGGLVSGLDTNSIIQQLMEVERRPVLQFQQKEADFQLHLSTYGSLTSELTALKSALEGLDKPEDFKNFSANSGDSERFSASAGSSAVAGTYNVTVHQLAQVHKLTSGGFVVTESVGQGTLTLQLGAGAQVTIDVAAGDTIADVAQAINAASDDITAGVIFDGSNSFLTLSGTQTGETNLIKVTVDDTGDGVHTDANGLSRLAYEQGAAEQLTQAQEAKDARIDVDGVKDIQRSTNILDDVITGVTITLTGRHADPLTESSTLTVERDAAAMTSAVEAFATAYNAVVDFITKNQLYDSGTDTAGPLLGDATANLIKRRLGSLVKNTVPGVEPYRRLSDLGVTLDGNGKLKVNATHLTEKLTTDFNAVVEFFTRDAAGAQGFTARMLYDLETILDAKTGVLAVRQTGIQDSIDDIQNSVARTEERIAATEARLRSQFNALELLLGEFQATSDYLAQQIVSLQNLNSSISKFSGRK